MLLTILRKCMAKLANSSLNSHLKFIKDVGYPTIFSASLIILLHWAKGGRKTNSSWVRLVMVLSTLICWDNMAVFLKCRIIAYDIFLLCTRMLLYKQFTPGLCYVFNFNDQKMCTARLTFLRLCHYLFWRFSVAFSNAKQN